MSLQARAVMLTVLLFVTITGCNAPAPAPTSPAVCAAEECNGKEPSEIHCDTDALSITTREGVYVEEGETMGVLEIRKSKPSVCDRIYWARFMPAPINTGSFEIVLELNGKRAEPQKSEPQNPEVTAWTTVLFVKKGEQLRACVKDVSTGKEKCTPVIEAV